MRRGAAVATTALVVVLAMGLSACSGNAGSGGDLEGKRWELASFGSASDAATLVPGSYVDAAFTGGRMAGTGGVNSYTAEFTAKGGAITVGEVASTLMAGPQPLMDQEQAYFDALASVESYTADEQKLEMFDAQGSSVLLFRVAESGLAGEWVAIGYLVPEREAFMSAIVDTTLTATFAEDGTVSGSSGCNTFTGSYESEGRTLAVGPFASTKMLCSQPEGVMEQEASYLAALQSAVAYDVRGRTLTLYDAEGRRAVDFVAAGEAPSIAPEGSGELSVTPK